MTSNKWSLQNPLNNKIHIILIKTNKKLLSLIKHNKPNRNNLMKDHSSKKRHKCKMYKKSGFS